MAQTAADVLIETLMDWGVELLFGLPGGIHLHRAHYTADVFAQPAAAILFL